MSDSKLSVVHFSTADAYGGSARAAYRIHLGLRARGHTSRMLVARKDSADPDVDTVHGGGFGRLKDRLADELTWRVGLQYQYVPSTRRVLRHAWTREASVFQLFNTHGGYFSFGLARKLSARAPLVWRLSDMWALTGHCAYSGDCDRWRIGCGKCPDLKTHPGVGIDTTAWLFKRKERTYGRSDLTIVAPSSWTERLARESPLLGRFPVHRIPNGLDSSVFHPIDRVAARAAFDLPRDGKVIIFVAHVLDANPRKGVPSLIEAVNRASLPEGTVLALVGEGTAPWRSNVRVPVRLLGSLSDDRKLALAYSAADVVAAPSVLENLPNTVLEAMACGTPAVAFDAGGMADAVRHDATGYLARYMEAADFATGLELLLGDEALRLRYSVAGRQLMENEFSMDGQARRFEALYEEVIDRRRGRERDHRDAHQSTR